MGLGKGELTLGKIRQEHKSRKEKPSFEKTKHLPRFWTSSHEA
jgi:hypothetical protein